MKLIDKDAVVAEIERRRNIQPVNNCGHQRVWAYNDVIDLLNSLEVSHPRLKSREKEPVGEDLEKAANDYANSLSEKCDKTYVAIDFKAGANWQKQQEYACYEEAFEDGARWEKEQMLMDAVEADVVIDRIGEVVYLCPHTRGDIETGDKVKVIIISEE